MAGKNKTYELMLKIGGKVDGSLKTACSTADKNLAALGKTAKTAGKIAAGAMVAAATAVATLGTAAVKSAAEYEAQLANVSTLLTGTEAEVAARTAEIGDQVLEISCNLDDMTGEEIGFAMERLLEAGALDVYTQSIMMKKSRPAVILTALIRPEEKEKMTELFFRHTTTIGVRCRSWERSVLQRESVTRQTPWGPVQVKQCTGCGCEKEKAEFEDLARIAREKNMSLCEVKKQLKVIE